MEICNDFNKIYSFLNLGIPYQVLIKKINDLSFRKYYVFDIREMDVSSLFNNFSNFQLELLEVEYFSREFMLASNTPCPISLFLYFVVDENTKGLNYEILSNMNLSFKNFISYDEYLELMKESKNKKVIVRKNCYLLNGSNYEFKNFNLLLGGNGVGKSVLLRAISKKIKSPIYYGNRDINTGELLKGGGEYCRNIFELVDKADGVPLLIDDLFFNSIDDHNKIKIIDMLCDYSHDADVYLTSCASSAERLIRKRTYHPNIINLNKKSS